MTHSWTCSNCGAVNAAPEDKRAENWRVRIRLYQGAKPDPEADTDPDTAPDQAGMLVISGLPSVAARLSELLSDFHNGKALSGVDDLTLRHRIKSLRPTLSRRGGNAVWRVPYQVGDPPHTAGAAAWTEWLARVDVERVDA
jgi:hypothetical protein